MILKIASNKAIKYACLNFHYAKSVPVCTFGYSVFNNKNEWCGVILYGAGANNNIHKSFDLISGEVIELVRMALNGKQESTSKAMAISLKLIKKHIPLIKLIISYADKDQYHVGTIYQATNWLYLGSSMNNKKDGSFIIKGKRIHGKTISDKIKRMGGLSGLSRKDFILKFFDKKAVQYITKGKHKYVYIFDKKIKNKIDLMAKPYPKKDILQAGEAQEKCAD